MPNRIVREGIISSRKMADLVRIGGWEAEVFYRRLINKVDDFGRYTADPTLLRTALYPRQLDMVREANMERNLAHCRDARLVCLYEANQEPYLVIRKFRQRSRASTSKYPQPPFDPDDDDDGHMTVTRPSPDGHPPPYSEAKAQPETKPPDPPERGAEIPPERSAALEVFDEAGWLLWQDFPVQHRGELMRFIEKFGKKVSVEIIKPIGETHKSRPFLQKVNAIMRAFRKLDREMESEQPKAAAQKLRAAGPKPTFPESTKKSA